MKNLLKITFIAFLAVFTISCSNDDNGDVVAAEITISNFVANNSDYSSLLAALDRAGLVATLDGTEEFTVFAPNNQAFDRFLNNNGFASLDDVPVNVLTNVLLNHVLDGTITSGDLSTGYVNSLATYGSGEDNLSMYIDLGTTVRINGQSSVTVADIDASNGVIHAVNEVIELPTVVTFAVADPTFETLVAALTRADQPDYVAVLSTADGTDPAPFTVFAPTNAAFGDLLAELGADSLDDIDSATLTATLNTHVIAGANIRAEDLTTGTVATLGDEISINAENATITDPNGRVSNIIVVNVQAANGVVHAIDKVLLPQL